VGIYRTYTWASRWASKHIGSIYSNTDDLANTVSTRDAWRAVETQFLGNRETRSLYLDVEFHGFSQGDLSITDNCKRLQQMASDLGALGEVVSNHTLSPQPHPRPQRVLRQHRSSPSVEPALPLLPRGEGGLAPGGNHLRASGSDTDHPRRYPGRRTCSCWRRQHHQGRRRLWYPGGGLRKSPPRVVTVSVVVAETRTPAHPLNSLLAVQRWGSPGPGRPSGTPKQGQSRCVQTLVLPKPVLHSSSTSSKALLAPPLQQQALLAPPLLAYQQALLVPPLQQQANAPATPSAAPSSKWAAPGYYNPLAGWDPQSLTSSFSTMTLNQPQKTDRYFDTGASSHMISHSNTFSHISAPWSFTPSTIIVGNGSLLPVTATGSTDLSGSFKLNNVLVSPHIIKNLISVRQFTTDNNCSVEFDPTGCSTVRCNSSGPLYPLHPLLPSPSTLPPPPCGIVTLVTPVVKLSPSSPPSFRCAPTMVAPPSTMRVSLDAVHVYRSLHHHLRRLAILNHTL